MQKYNQGTEKLHMLLIDLKAAFDKVNRKKLWQIMESK